MSELKPEQNISVEIVSGIEGLCLLVNDYRVAGPKPWGGGTVTQSFKTKLVDIERAIYGNRRAQPENEPIVRCGECIHFEPYDGEEYKGDCNELVGLDSCMYEDDYCSYGERKPERSEG